MKVQMIPYMYTLFYDTFEKLQGVISSLFMNYSEIDEAIWIVIKV